MLPYLLNPFTNRGLYVSVMILPSVTTNNLCILITLAVREVEQVLLIAYFSIDFSCTINSSFLLKLFLIDQVLSNEDILCLNFVLKITEVFLILSVLFYL